MVEMVVIYKEHGNIHKIMELFQILDFLIVQVKGMFNHELQNEKMDNNGLNINEKLIHPKILVEMYKI